MAAKQSNLHINPYLNQLQNGTNLSDFSLLSEHDLVIKVFFLFLHHHDGQAFLLCFLLLLQACWVIYLHFPRCHFDLQRLKRKRDKLISVVCRNRNADVKEKGSKVSYLALRPLFFHLLKILLFCLFIFLLFIFIVIFLLFILTLLIIIIFLFFLLFVGYNGNVYMEIYKSCVQGL